MCGSSANVSFVGIMRSGNTHAYSNPFESSNSGHPKRLHIHLQQSTGWWEKSLGITIIGGGISISLVLLSRPPRETGVKRMCGRLGHQELERWRLNVFSILFLGSHMATGTVLIYMQGVGWPSVRGVKLEG